MHNIPRRLSPSLILASLALFALAGTAAAAAIITSPDQLADRVVTSPKLAQPVVAAGVNQGLNTGDQPFLINPTSEVVSVEGSPAGAENQGFYIIRFSGAVRHCQWTATPADSQSVVEEPAFIRVRPSQVRADEVLVFTSVLKTQGASKGSVVKAPASFYLMGRC